MKDLEDVIEINSVEKKNVDLEDVIEKKKINSVVVFCHKETIKILIEIEIKISLLLIL